MKDFCIMGSGMVGATLALGLVSQGHSVVLIEPHMPQSFSPEQPPDLRVSALSVASVDLLKALGAWEFIEQTRMRAYRQLSVWEAENARTDFTAELVNLPELGYFVENRLLQLGCLQALANKSNFELITSSQVKSIDLSDKQAVNIELNDKQKVSAHWLIGADGARSQVRKAARIACSGWQYEQQALGIIVSMHEPQTDITWQQFTPAGPRAYLPMYDNYAALIWYDKADRVRQLAAMTPAQLKQPTIEAFPDLLGDFDVVFATGFPLTRSHASDYVKGNVVLIGDAAHTINPLAGQGVNLGFRDIEALLAITADADTSAHDALRSRLQKEYERPRRRDNLMMMSAMDGFYTLFSNDILPLKLARQSLLTLAQHLPFGKKQVLKYALGLNEWKF
ncbi:FAD-dependent monooxygenase [Alteromonas ponticola]|uniref:2-octaprenyl-3-methyl-6-methoxy-1,4-benzoquinol hydroxylase n=1 Tax=Alteromonas ponticola TaxID=2720613 RepID=A0ABX1QX43_9ALTE|nr:FAD-dependent monooxygenase [Alteromonas ponticola]NMH58819.1 2-octaprenyl-3-methyl-6-methoxy-1,4-benzoquinol hydroxylase [Alteromonas ponticola]